MGASVQQSALGRETVTQEGGFRVQRIYGGPRMIVVVFLTKFVSIHNAEKETYRLSW